MRLTLETDSPRRHRFGRRRFIRGVLGAGLIAARGLATPSPRLWGIAAAPVGAPGVGRLQPAAPADPHRALLSGFDSRLLPPGFSVVRVSDVTLRRTSAR
jgi:hypothetical protein